MSLLSPIRSVVLGLIKLVPDSQRRLFDLWLETHAADPTPEAVVHAYLAGRFPLTCPDSGQIFWRTENPRGLIPIHEFHIPKNLKRLLRRDTFRVSIDFCF